MSGIVELEGIVKDHAAMVRRIASAYERYPDRIECRFLNEVSKLPSVVRLGGR
jgi:hypothetical protein